MFTGGVKSCRTIRLRIIPITRRTTTRTTVRTATKITTRTAAKTAAAETAEVRMEAGGSTEYYQ